jgi:hypothetical protein
MGSPITEVGYQSQCYNLGISHIPLNVLLTSLLANGLVKEFVKFLFDLTHSMQLIPVSISCLTILCIFLIINLAPCSSYGSLSITIKTQIKLNLYIKANQLINKLLRHSSSVPTFSKATNSNSIVNLAMQICFEDFQEIAHPARVNI